MAHIDEQPIKQSCLEVQTDLNALPQVWQWFEQFNLPQFPENLWNECQVALTEGFTNAVRHAHKGLPSTTLISVEGRVFADYVEIRIWDQGQPFNLEAKLQSLLEEPPNPWKEDGRGLIFMKQLMDSLSYLRLSNQQNCLVMRKRVRG